MGSWPNDVGLHAIELVFPPRYVDQAELEAHDGASAGKYTLGLGQRKMGFCTDREDVHSLCLTAVRRLLERHALRPADIGRLEVGTETLLDKSKSVKTVLMQLFEPDGVCDLEGVDATNACYGGTAALFNALAWVESSAWNGRFALVVAADIAVYAKGSARPTGGAGAVALLIGADAPLVFDRGTRATHVRHVYDFYKPDLTSEYPTVDGRLSIQCYLSALDHCYRAYCRNVETLTGAAPTVDNFDAMLFHSPYCKLVQKSLARLHLNDYLRAPAGKRTLLFPAITLPDVALETSYFDRDVERAFLAHSLPYFEARTSPSLLVAREVGNMYTPSLYGALVSLLAGRAPGELAGMRIGMFSYGSGLAASLFAATVRADGDRLRRLVGGVRDVAERLARRVKVAPAAFEACLEARERNGHRAPFEPEAGVEEMEEGAYYLVRVDEKHRRFYERVPVAANGHA